MSLCRENPATKDHLTEKACEKEKSADAYEEARKVLHKQEKNSSKPAPAMGGKKSSGKTKKSAEQMAAELALQMLAPAGHGPRVSGTLDPTATE